jgi:hypothetical protein
VVPIAEGIDHKLFHEQLVVDLLAKELTFNELLKVCHEVRSNCTSLTIAAVMRTNALLGHECLSEQRRLRQQRLQREHGLLTSEDDPDVA